MALTSRDRVGVDLRGIGDAVRAAARARCSTVAAFAREALVEAIGRPSTLPEGIAAEFGRAEIVKLTLRLREAEADALILKATGLGLSYGEYVARLVRQTPLPMPAAVRPTKWCPRRRTGSGAGRPRAACPNPRAWVRSVPRQGSACAGLRPPWTRRVAPGSVIERESTRRDSFRRARLSRLNRSNRLAAAIRI